MMLGKVVGFVENAFAPNNVKLFLSDAISCPIVARVEALDLFCLTLSLAMPAAVLLSVTMTVGGCG